MIIVYYLFRFYRCDGCGLKVLGILLGNTFANERRKKALKVKRAFVGN
jgi:hypothetical protein